MKLIKFLFAYFLIIFLLFCTNKKNKIKNPPIKDSTIGFSKSKNNNSTIIKVTTNVTSAKLKNIKSKSQRNNKLVAIIEGKIFYKKNDSDYLFVEEYRDAFCYLGNIDNIHLYSFLDVKKRKTYDITTGKYYEIVHCGGPIRRVDLLLNGNNLHHPDHKPEYFGGLEKLNEYFIENYKLVLDSIPSGNVVASFVVEKNGELTDIKIIRDIGYGTGKETKRILESSINWIPAIKNHEKISVLYSVILKISNTGLEIKYGFK